MTFTRWLLQTRMKITCCQRTVSSNIEGICKHISLSLPANRHGSNIWEESTEICLIFNYVLDFIYSRHSYRMSALSQNLLFPDQLLSNCCGFIDGTVTNFTTYLKKWLLYNGHKWEFMLSNSKVWHYIKGLVEILGGHTKRDAMKAQRYNNLNYFLVPQHKIPEAIKYPLTPH